MSEWQAAFEQLAPRQRENISKWIYLNECIADVLGLERQEWFEVYVQEALQKPLDFSFVGDIIPGVGLPELVGVGERFERTAVDAMFAVPKVAISPENWLGRMTPALQASLPDLLHSGTPDRIKLHPADVANMQKMFRNHKPVAKLKRPHFRKIELCRDGPNVTLAIVEGELLMEISALEFAAVLSRKWL